MTIIIIMKQKEEWSNISPRISFQSFVSFSRLYFVWLFDHYDDDDGDEDLLGGIMGIEAGYTNVAIWGTSFLGTWLLAPSIYFMALSFYPPWLKLKEADICNSFPSVNGNVHSSQIPSKKYVLSRIKLVWPKITCR